MAVIVIDPGHGGTRKIGGSSPNNATGPAGSKEKTLTLAIGLAARTALTGRGHTVFMTRTTDENVGLAARAHVARDHRAAAFVSIHLNASDAHTAQGTETWLHARHSGRSKRLAERVQARVVAATQLRDRRVQAKGLGVLAPNDHFRDTACCLVEVSFLDRPDEEQRLLKPEYQNAVANAIGDAVNDYLAAPAAAGEVPEAVAREARFEDTIAATAIAKRPAPRRARPPRAAKRTKAKAPRTSRKRKKARTKRGTKARAGTRTRPRTSRRAKSAARSRKR
jgi:N-acetylmuramoyl-L-alanine amidase